MVFDVGRRAAFSAIEIIVVVAMTVVIGLIGVLDLGELVQNFAQINAQHQLITDMRRAQNLAITLGCRGIFKTEDSGSRYSFDCDFLDYDLVEPIEGDNICTASLCPKFTGNLPSHVTLDLPDEPIIFNSRGLLIDVEGDFSSQAFSLNYNLGGTETTFKSGTILTTGALNFDT